MKKTIICWIPTTTCIMNWLARTTEHVGIFGLIILSALFSCEDPGELGLVLIEDDDGLGVLESEIPLSASVVQLDSINTTNRGILMAGDYTDSDFGNIRVQNFQRILPPATTVSLPEEVLSFDSVKMNYQISYFYGDDFATPHSLSIHRLQEQLLPDTIYYSNQSTSFDMNSLVDTTFMISEEDTVLSIDLEPMKDEFFDALKDYVSDSTNAANFSEQFKGFTMVTDPSSNAVLGFNPQALESKLTFYYTTADTVVNRLELVYSTYYNQIIADYTGTNLEGIVPLTEFYPMDERTYLQTGTGVVPKINFQSYFDFLDNDTTGTIVVNKAELIFSNLEGLADAIQPPLQMSFYYTDDSNEFLETDTEPPFPNTIQTDGIYISATRNNIDPYNLTSQSQRAQLDTTNIEFAPQVTLFLQLIADGLITREQAQQVLVVPFSFVENPTSVRDFGRNLDRFALQPSNLRLKIIYTRLR